MTAADVPTTSASALRLVLSAERLFAEHGIDGVSLRQIAADAGSGNKSAVHYPFGSKEKLITAIFKHRLPQLIGERRLLTARCDPDDLRARLEAQFLPVLALAEASDSRYVSFVEQLQRHEVGVGSELANLPAEGRRTSDEFRQDLEALLPHVDERVRTMRIAEAQALCLHAAADRERTVASDAPVVAFPVFANSLLDGLTGFLSARVSAATLRGLREGHDPAPPRPRLL